MTAEQILDITTHNATTAQKGQLSRLREETLREIGRALADKNNRWVRLLGLGAGSELRPPFRSASTLSPGHGGGQCSGPEAGSARPSAPIVA